MSISRQKVTDLVGLYDYSLEQQIMGQGSNLACQEEELWKQVEGLLRDQDAQEVHCLGVDSLRVMEESLKTAAAVSGAAGTGRVKVSGRLQGLAKAFEVLEQAALNLYLGPWREEYKVVKMYSGTFTHSIKPVLSMPQIEKLFGLLGYKPATSSRPEQLQLHQPRVTSLDDLLRLSCAFFLARCECHLLLTTLGKNAGEVQWELGMVRERQRGNDVQVSLDNTRRTLEVNQQEAFDGEPDVDLYTDKQVNGAQRVPDVNGRESGLVHEDEGSPHSLIRMSQSSVAVKQQSNGLTPLSSSTFLTAREHFPIFSRQATTSLKSGSTRQQVKRPQEQTRQFHIADSQPPSLQVEAVKSCMSDTESSHYCSCVQSPSAFLKLCIDCNTFHNITCALLAQCNKELHNVVYPNDPRDEVKELIAVSSPCESLRASDEGTSSTLTSSSATMSSLALRDDTTSLSPSVQPITYHDCCDLSQPDPDVLCITCGVFHSNPCTKINYCHSHHTTRMLRVCLCGEKCPRKPLVLCRYCGKEYCSDCWYRNPVKCHCGQTFDQSSPV